MGGRDQNSRHRQNSERRVLPSAAHRSLRCRRLRPIGRRERTSGPDPATFRRAARVLLRGDQRVAPVSRGQRACPAGVSPSACRCRPVAPELGRPRARHQRSGLLGEPSGRPSATDQDAGHADQAEIGPGSAGVVAPVHDRAVEVSQRVLLEEDVQQVPTLSREGSFALSCCHQGRQRAQASDQANLPQPAVSGSPGQWSGGAPGRIRTCDRRTLSSHDQRRSCEVSRSPADQATRTWLASTASSPIRSVNRRSHRLWVTKQVTRTAPISRHRHALAIGRAKVDGQSDSRWATDEKAVRFLLNGLRRWQPKSRAEPDQVTMQGDAVPVAGGGEAAVGLTPGLR